VLTSSVEVCKHYSMDSDLISTMAHEMRTPLTAITGFAATILRDADMPDDVLADFASIIIAESNYLDSLITNLQDLVRIDSNDFKLNRMSLAVSDLFVKMRQIFSERLKKKGLKFDWNVSEGTGNIHADSAIIQTAIASLIDNAVKYTPEGGRIALAGKRQQHEILIEIKDSGTGIAETDLDKIFESFYKGDQAGNKIKGAGLGLTIAKGIILKHQGRIEIESELEKGTTALVYLPVFPAIVEMSDT